MSGRKGLTLLELIAVLVALVLLSYLFFTFENSSANSHAKMRRRASCKSNMSSIGKALAMYQAGYNDQSPFIDSSPKGWASAATGANLDKPKADGSSEYNMSAFLFLLVRYGQSPNIFVCPGERTAKGDPNYRDEQTNTYNWDFHSAQNLSYSYQCPVRAIATSPSDPAVRGYRSGFSSSSSSDLVVAADKTPTANGLDTAATDWANPNLTNEQKKQGVSQNHGGDYMNLLFSDTHVGDTDAANVGIDHDNIFSCAESEAIESPTGLILKPQTSPKGGMTIEKHLSDKDSFLLGPK